MSITEYTGENLLQNEIIQKIQKQADLLLQNKDVAGAWQAGNHLKTEIAKIKPELIKPVLADYRKITTKLKALSLPLLNLDEVINLLRNNLEFLEKSYLHYFVGGIKAWIALQPEQDQKNIINQILSSIPSNSPFFKEIKIAVKSAADNEIAAVANRPPRNDVGPVKISNKDNLFNKEEVNDLQIHAKKAAEVGLSGLKVDNLEKIAQEIFTISASKEDKEAFLRRAAALLKSRLRDVRTKLNLKEYFSKPFAVGGLGLSGEILDKSINISEDAYGILHKENTSEIIQKQTPVAEPKPKFTITKPVIASERTCKRGNSAIDAGSGKHEFADPVPSMPEGSASTPSRNDMDPNITKKPIPIPKPAKKFEIPKFTTKPAPKTESKVKLDKLIAQDASDSINLSPLIPRKSSRLIGRQAELRVKSQESGVQKESLSIPESSISTPPKAEMKRNATRIIRPQKNNLDGKPRMQDITRAQGAPAKHEAKSVDLSGELGLMSLDDFRNLGTPEQAVQSLLQKLEVLEQDSVPKKIQGIKALRSSELNKQYIAIGEASIGAGKKLAQVLEDKSLNPDLMTEDEFFTIATLNSKLK